MLLRCKDRTILFFGQLFEIAKKVKALKVISGFSFGLNHLEEKLYNEYGIAIQITNNKRKALANVDIIINFDFTEEKLKEYYINKEAILVNVTEEINGLAYKNINNYKIEYDKENFDIMDNEVRFDSNVIYESYIYRRDTLQNIRKQLKADNVRLTGLI